MVIVPKINQLFAQICFVFFLRRETKIYNATGNIMLSKMNLLYLPTLHKRDVATTEINKKIESASYREAGERLRPEINSILSHLSCHQVVSFGDYLKRPLVN